MKLEEINNKTNEAFSFLVAALESGERVIQRPFDLLNGGAWLLLKRTFYERLDFVVRVQEFEPEVAGECHLR